MNLFLLGLKIKLVGLGAGLANLWHCVSCHGASPGLTSRLLNTLWLPQNLWGGGCPGLSWVLLCKISLGEGRQGPIGVDLN